MKILSLACAAALAFTVAAPVLAQTPALTATGGRTFDGDGPWTLGWSFTVDSTITVTGLGAYDLGGDGFAAAHAVGLWDASQNLLASTSVDSSGQLIDGFRYAGISALTLTPGTYFVGAADLGTGDGYLLEASTVTIAGVTFLNSQFASGGGLLFPASAGVPGSYFGGNFLVGEIPEPGTWAMMIAGFGLVGFAARRRTAATVAA